MYRFQGRKKEGKGPVMDHEIGREKIGGGVGKCKDKRGLETAMSKGV